MNQATTFSPSSVGKTFTKYVSQNILGMLGISAYILADTFFIARAEGADGITALNLVLPLYSLIFAIGSMMATGSATRFKILRARGNKKADSYFPNALLFAVIFGLFFVALGVLVPSQIIRILGGDAEITAIGTPYTRIFLLFAPFFMCNYICNAFVRNDGNPSLAMTATLCSNFFNIVMDYVLMFPLGLGMAGAALATAISPIVGICICTIHFLSPKSTIHFRLMLPSLRMLAQSCQLGIAAFVGEISSGITTIVFNFLLLNLAGNTGVAAYGVIANIAIVATALFNGIAQGTQPLNSEFYGKGDSRSVRKVLRLSFATALGIALLILLTANMLAAPIVSLFNHEQDARMAAYAVTGMKLYFIGYLFAGFNIVGTGYLSATAAAKWAFVTSISRGFAAITACAFLLASLLGITGVWLAFPAAELLTAVVMCFALKCNVK